MIISDSPCYLCQQRALGCHSKCPQYIEFSQHRQVINREQQADVGVRTYNSDRYYKILRRCR